MVVILKALRSFQPHAPVPLEHLAIASRHFDSSAVRPEMADDFLRFHSELALHRQGAVVHLSRDEVS